MKKVLFTAFAAMAMFAMTACNNNNQTAEAADTANVEAVACEQAEHHCDMEAAHECQCGEECAAANCEGCPNHGTENCCKAKAAAAGEGEACEHACKKACDKPCDKAEGKECCKKAAEAK